MYCQIDKVRDEAIQPMALERIRTTMMLKYLK